MLTTLQQLKESRMIHDDNTRIKNLLRSPRPVPLHSNSKTRAYCLRV